MDTAIILLIRTVISVLSINDVRETVHRPFVEDNNTYIKPDGPLNFLHGHAYYKDSLAHKMRLYSPAFKINYTLTKSENKDEDDRFEINNNKDGINTFKGNDRTSKYLISYYKVFREMFNVVNNEVNIHTARESSLFIFLTGKLGETARFRLLATMILLAEGVEVPLKIENRSIPFNESKITVPVLTCKDGSANPFLEVEMYEIFKRPRVHNQDGSFVEEKEVLHKLKDMMDLVKFFINCGGKNIGGLSALNLEFNETPRFLIHYYVFELMEALSDARQLFSAVKELLEYMRNGEGSKAWNLLFTKDHKELEKYEPALEIYRLIDKAMVNMGFPFSIFNQPPSNVVVKGYNRKKSEEITSNNLRFNDCCDITIYSLLCCLFYSPVDNIYSLNHLGDRNYRPSGDLSTFFGSVCNKPVETTSQDLHQKWTHVVQDLVLSEGELRGEEASGMNTIVYRKEENGVHAEIKTELLNVLKIVAKITGMPKERMIELNGINSMANDAEAIWDDVRRNVESFTTQLIQDISIMPVEVSFEELKLAVNNGFRRIYGIIKLKFTTASDNNASSSQHDIKFRFIEGHAVAVISDDYNIGSEIKDALNGLIAECNNIEGSLGKRVMMYGNKLLQKRKFELVLLESVKEIEEAENELERYSAINRVLIDYSFNTMDNKLYFIDLFGPYLERMTARDSNTEKRITDIPQSIDGVPTQNPQDSVLVQKLSSTKIAVNKAFTHRNQLETHDPVVQLITNIMGSVPLGDMATQKFFIQIFGFCNGEYKRLFPNFRGDSFNILPEFTDLEMAEKNVCDGMLMFNIERKTVPNTLFRLFGILRAMYKDNFFQKLKDKSNLFKLYISAIEKSMWTKNLSVIEVAKKDFKIQDGLMEPDPDLFFRAASWFSMAMNSGYCEGVEIVFNNWEAIRGKGNALFILFQRNSIAWFNWYTQIPNDLLSRLYGNEHNEKIIMEMYCYFSAYSYQFVGTYNFLVSSRHIIALFEVLYNFLRDIVESKVSYVSDRLKSQYPIEHVLFSDPMRHLDSLYRFIKQIDILKNAFVERLKQLDMSHSNFDKSFDVMYDQLNGMRILLRKNCDEMNIKENLDMLEKYLNRDSSGKDSRVDLCNMLKLMENACKSISIPGESKDTGEFDKEACEKLSDQEKLDRIKKLLKKFVIGLKLGEN